MSNQEAVTLANQYLEVMKEMVAGKDSGEACETCVPDPLMRLVINSMVGDQLRSRNEGGVNYIAWAEEILKRK